MSVRNEEILYQKTVRLRADAKSLMEQLVEVKKQRDELVEALGQLVGRWIDFQASGSRNQQDAYYSLAKQAFNDWQKARAVLEKVKNGR